ncbi:hypothetical protein AAF712_006962 [Marasmius tenuissimus]|uniref:Uncharacterized protein n=1 Tax=Marasmius tenuissimus TaxID=585030 RepID=A0ABR2ZYU9_9AGAR
MDLGDDDLRLHTIQPGTPPREASLSDFAFAIAPTLWLYVVELNALKTREEKRLILRQLLRLLWVSWAEVWEDSVEFYTGLTRAQFTVLREVVSAVLAEYDLHRYHVRKGRKADQPRADDIPWDTAIQKAIHESNFERWTDPKYVASVRPPSVKVEELESLPWEEMLAKYLDDDERRMREAKLVEERERRERHLNVDTWQCLFMC